MRLHINDTIGQQNPSGGAGSDETDAKDVSAEAVSRTKDTSAASGDTKAKDGMSSEREDAGETAFDRSDQLLFGMSVLILYAGLIAATLYRY